MRKLLFLSIFLILIFSCTTQKGKISKSKDFLISKNTQIAVQCDSDELFGASLESKLLNMGFDVVPYETIIEAYRADTDIKSSSSEDSIKIESSTSAYNVKYVPSRIVINVNFKLHRYPMATYFLGGYIRIIDIYDKKLLASFEYTGNEFTLYNQNDILNKFVNDLSHYIKDKN